MQNSSFAYVGAYTTEGDITVSRNAHAKGIKVYKVDHAHSEWELIQETETLNPAVLALTQDKKFLYCVESDSNVISGFAIDSETGLLSKITSIKTGGSNTIVLGISHDRTCLVASDHSGLLSAISIAEDGKLTSIFEETLSPGKPGPLNATFQPHSRPHHIVFSPDDKYCVIPDKGFDKVHIYEIDAKKGIFRLFSQTDCRRAGCPRHAVFSPDGKNMFLNLEFGNSIVAFDFHNGKLTPYQIIPTLPESYVGTVSKTSEIAIHPTGRWLYVSNRGHDSIAVFEIDQKSQCLKPIQWKESAGKIPRFFAIDPSGQSLLCCNQFSDNIAVFAINQHYGTLELRKVIDNVPGSVWMQLSGIVTPPDLIGAKPGQGVV